MKSAFWCADFSWRTFLFTREKNIIYSFEQLDKIRIQYLRDIAREIGVKAPTSFKKDVLIEEILQIQSGRKAPYTRTKKGRPLKENFRLESAKDNIRLVEKIEKNLKKEIIDCILKEIEKKLYKIL